MIVTEDEARKPWCPMARVIVDSDGSYNRSEIGDPGHSRTFIPQSSKCLARGCAMWRQHDETKGILRPGWAAMTLPPRARGRARKSPTSPQRESWRSWHSSKLS